MMENLIERAIAKRVAEIGEGTTRGGLEEVEAAPR